MTATFTDIENEANPLNGMILQNVNDVAKLFRFLRDSLKTRKPFTFELHNDNGFMLTIGLADDCGTVQYSSSEGLPPYLMAVGNDAADDNGFVEFLAGGTPTPIPRRFCLPIERVETIAADFLARGSRSEAVAWEGI